MGKEWAADAQRLVEWLRDWGNALLTDGERAAALLCFPKGLEINPGYPEFRNRIMELEK